MIRIAISDYVPNTARVDDHRRGYVPTPSVYGGTNEQSGVQQAWNDPDLEPLSGLPIPFQVSPFRMLIDGITTEQIPASDRGLHYGDGLF